MALFYYSTNLEDKTKIWLFDTLGGKKVIYEEKNPSATPVIDHQVCLWAAELEIVVCSDKFVGTALVPTKLVGTAVPTNLSEQTTWCSNRK